MNNITKKAVVIHSGGMDSSICLALAIKEFGAEQIVSLGFDYGQRHHQELVAAEKICSDWNVDRFVIKLDYMQQIISNALMGSETAIQHEKGSAPNTLVMGRNGLMVRLGTIYAHSLGVSYVYMGVLEEENSNSGYRDCSRSYMDLMEKVLRIDLDDPTFEIRTPIVTLTKLQTLELAEELGVLDDLIEKTITCYQGIKPPGCKTCPSCILRNQAEEKFRVRS